MTTTILKQKIVFNKKLIIEEGRLIDEEGKSFKRSRLNRQDAACVLILNTDSDKYILTRQYRYAIAAKTTEIILEIVAGKVDKGEEPLEAAIRESLEETGYLVKKKNIKFLTSCFASPGYTSERFYIYFATVTNADKINKGGGKKNENESIEIEEMAVNDFDELIKSGEIKDSKTYIAALLCKQKN
ncbi:MAG: NUDIX hydrolase [Bacteroidia bacterium]|nr:NUDIX hydrolase [Bacteroidia bacterium]